MSEVVLGVCGGIASYKSAELLRLFTESGHSVRVVPTSSSLKFVGAATWEALSGKPVQTEVFEHVDEVAHVRIGQGADLVVVAPATANILAKATHGLADDLLTNTLLTARCPLLFVPAMHTEMWENAATQANVDLLRSRGHMVVEPAVGRLTGADSGKGRFPEPASIYALCEQMLHHRSKDLLGKYVVVSAGGTREFVDPVRFLGNKSSGRQGFAIAEAAVSRGARVSLIAANVSLPTPAGADLVEVVTTADLRDEMLRLAPDADALVMAAAPADFRPLVQTESKIKKTSDGVPPELRLIENPDILKELVQNRTQERQEHPYIIGFAAETGDDTASVIEHGQAKLRRKGCDLLVVNDVSEGRAFGQADNEAVILGADGLINHVPFGPKITLAHAIWDRYSQEWDAPES